MTTFHILWSIDNWTHEHLPRRLHRLFFGRVCDWLDNELTKPATTFHKGA